MKTTFAIVGGEERAIQKNPATDSGTKKSARGALAVKRTVDVDGNSNWILVEDVPPEEIGGDRSVLFTMVGFIRILPLPRCVCEASSRWSNTCLNCFRN